MHLTGRAVMSGCIALAGAGVIIQALQWPFDTALFPVMVGIPVFLLGLADFFLNLFEKGKKGEATIDFQFSGGVDKAVEKQRTLSIFIWILGFFFLVLLAGFPVAVPLFVFLYLKMEARVGWVLSVVNTVVTWGIFYGLFVWFLNVPFMEGFIQKGLRALGLL